MKLKVIVKTNTTKPVFFGVVDKGLQALTLHKKLVALGWTVLMISI